MDIRFGRTQLTAQIRLAIIAGLASIAILATGVSAQSLSKAVPCVCTALYEPVCARTKTGRRATFSNKCNAGCEGAVMIRKGKC